MVSRRFWEAVRADRVVGVERGMIVVPVAHELIFIDHSRQFFACCVGLN
jgi:hypothetical protein